jgi:tetratricopeptide (TPR) repeat protein
MKSRHLVLPLALALAFAPAASADEKKDKEKDKKAPPAAKTAGPSADELLTQAEAKAAAGDAAGATELAHKATAAPGAAPETGLRVGRVLESAKDLDGAIDAYKAAAEKLAGASKAEALARQSVLQEVRGMPESAASAQAAQAADAEGAWTLVALARQRAREGKGDEAAQLAAQAAAKGAGAAAQSALGRAEEARSNWAAAEAAYRAAGGADATDVVAATGLARVMRRTGKAAEAAPIIEKVLAGYPGAVDAYKESARIKIALNRADEAFGDASTAAALAEADPEAQRVLQEATVAKALGYIAQNQPDLALQDLTALRDKQDSGLVRLGLGRALAAKRQGDAALVELAKASELEPSLADAHFHAGHVQLKLKQNAQAAIAEYEKASALEPANTEYTKALGAAWTGLGESHVQAKRYKDAITALNKASGILPNNPQVEAYLAWSYFGLKDAAQFKAHGAKARTLGYKEPTLLAYLTRIEAGEPIK